MVEEKKEERRKVKRGINWQLVVKLKITGLMTQRTTGREVSLVCSGKVTMM